jgi:hypothetical protein
MDHKEFILKLEQQALCASDLNILNQWFTEVVNAENSVMMSVTERAKSKTLNSIIYEYNLSTANSRVQAISLVRREAVRQRKQKLLKVERHLMEHLKQ